MQLILSLVDASMIVNMSRAGDWSVRGSAWFTAGSASASLIQSSVSPLLSPGRH